MLGTVIEDLAEAVDGLQTVELTGIEARDLLATMRELEVVRRRLDAGTDRVVGECERTAAFVADGHKSAKSCVKHLGRLSGAEALGRTRTVRALPQLPAVARAYAEGRIPTGCVRAIARVVANPRVRPFLEVADPVFAEMASSLGHDDFCAWLRDWECLADADGAASAAERGHERRNARLVHNEADGTWWLESEHGDLQGAVMADILDAFVQAELDADIAWAKDQYGSAWTMDDLPRTGQQRRADALFAIFRRAMAQPADAKNPEPLVSIVLGDDDLEAEVRRQCGDPAPADPSRVDDTVCSTITGRRIHPSSALAAMIVGHVRRVAVDADSNVIDLGRRRRFFTGSSRDAAFIQALLKAPGRPGCLFPGCDTPHRRLEVDHTHAYGTGGATNPGNSGLGCGVHNRLKEHGFRPVIQPDGSWTIHRPDRTPITPSA
ncbi:MAG: DUF222 domain-containing protein [Acidimicrobiales bacterium]|nr:DUF222 domain-containing protein [Acidimicrobiales bacterium]